MKSLPVLADLRQRRAQLFAGMASIGKDVTEPWKTPRHLGEQATVPVTVVDIGHMNPAAQKAAGAKAPDRLRHQASSTPFTTSSSTCNGTTTRSGSGVSFAGSCFRMKRSTTGATFSRHLLPLKIP